MDLRTRGIAATRSDKCSTGKPVCNHSLHAQNLFQNQTIHKTNADLLSGLRRLLQEHGSVSEKLINESRDLPSAEPYVRGFGSLSEAFEKIGYIGSQPASTRAKRRVRAMRTQIVRQVIATAPTRITLVQPDGHFRPRFRVSGLLVSLYLCGCSSRRDGRLCWLVNTVRRERNCIALIVRLNHGNETIMDMFMVSDIRSHTRYKHAADDPWLRRGKRLSSFDNFLGDVRLINASVSIGLNHEAVRCWDSETIVPEAAPSAGVFKLKSKTGSSAPGG